ncbi:MAG: Uma2 family endonuclease [Saprospiraceae bacterium]
MTSTTAIASMPAQKGNKTGVASKPKAATRQLTLEEFRRKYSTREDGYKYEFVKGEIVKTPSNMNPAQLFIVRNLSRFFSKTSAYASGAELIPEVDQVTLPLQLRRPDLSLWTSERIEKAQDESVSEFVIEIISPTDRSVKVEEKVLEYFEAGVKVVWLLFPQTQTVHIYTSPVSVMICKDDRLCSAAPVVPDFEMRAAEVFARKM